MKIKKHSKNTIHKMTLKNLFKERKEVKIMIEVKTEYNFQDLLDKSWSGAIDTLKTIEEEGKEEELMELLNEIFLDRIPTDTELNDLLWFEDDWLFEQLGIESEE